MIRSELPMDPVQRPPSTDRAKPSPDVAEGGDFARWIQPQDAGQTSSRRAEGEVAPGAPNPLVTAVVLSASSGMATGVLYGWGLQSNSALSQWVIDHAHVASAAPRIQSNATAEARRSGDAPESRGTAVPRVVGESIGNQAHVSLRMLHLTTSDRTRATDSGNAAAKQEAMAAPLLWSERTLRRISTQDGGMTVWLRDYRLSSRDIERALAELISQPAEENPITRVVINGVEVWRQSPPTSQEIV